MRRIVVVVSVIGLLGLFAQVAVGVGTEGKPFFLAQQPSVGQAGSSEGVSKAQSKPSAPAYADVAKIFLKYNCGVCHGESEPRGGVSVANYKSLMKGGKDGPVIRVGQPGKSELILRLKGLAEPRMPYGGPPWLTDDEVATIERWIAAGAPEGK